MRPLLSSLILMISLLAIGQSEEEQRAAYHYQNGEYEKAVVLYKELHNKTPGAVYIYENYLQCLLLLDERKESISVVKRQIKRYPAVLGYQVDLAHVYQQFGMQRDRDELIESLILSHRTKDRNSVHQLTQSFVRREFHREAIRTLEGAVTEQGLDAYWASLMNLYRMTGENDKAIRLGLEVVKHSARDRYAVSFHFSRIMEDGGASFEDAIQKECLRYIQNYPDHEAFGELLMDVHMYRKNFRAAYRQAKAMDLRSKGNGARLLSLAQTCINNKAYDVAAQCFSYIMEKGPNSLHYIDARIGYLQSSYLALKENPYRSAADVEAVVQAYEAFIQAYGYSSGTAASMRELALVQLFYNKNMDRSIQLLLAVVELRRIPAPFRGECKLLLADAYLMKGDPWEARLLYGQVDKEFKEDPLGQEAKFRNARLAYFTGDFDWAVDQLDILKTASSQLVANNALDLSLLIQENTGLDTSFEAMSHYAQAEFLLFQKQYGQALATLELIPTLYPDHSLGDEMLFLKARIHQETGDYNGALELYRQVYTDHANDILADNALFAAAEIQADVLQDAAAAAALYEQIILNYSSSLYVVEARKRYERSKETPLP